MTLQLAKVEDEYKKFPQLKQEEVLKLQEWVRRQPHLPNISELETIIPLHSCYYSMEVAKIYIDAYYTVRTHCPELFEQRDVSSKSTNAAMDILLYSPLPDLTPEGYKVIYCKVLDSDPLKLMFGEAVKLFTMCADLFYLKEGTVEGYVCVLDLNNIVFGHIPRADLALWKKFMYYFQDALPIRLKAIHVINTVPFMDTILMIVRPFLKKETIEIIKLHAKLDTFYEYVPQEMLPKECGGKSGSFIELRDRCYEHVRCNQSFFSYDEQNRRVNEKLRPGKPKVASDIFGVDGNFRKLDLD